MFALLGVSLALVQSFLGINLLGMRLFTCDTLHEKYIPPFVVFQGLMGKSFRSLRRFYIGFFNRVGTVGTQNS